METSVPIAEYARSRGLKPATVRRWLRECGAPYSERGGRGPGRAYRVNPDELDAWRGLTVSSSRAVLAAVAAGLDDVRLRGVGDGRPATEVVDIAEHHAAAILLMAYGAIARRIDPDVSPLADPPREIVTLITIVEHRFP